MINENELKEYCKPSKKSDSDDIDDIILELGEEECNIALNECKKHKEKSRRNKQLER